MNRFKSLVIKIWNKCSHCYKYKDFGAIGKNCIIAKNCSLVPRNMYLEDYVIIQEDTNFISNKGKLIIKKYSVISAGCIIIPGTHKLKVGVPFYLSTKYHIADEEKDIVINEDCWIGAGCVLLPGVNIGRGCIIGAGSVVTKDIPPYCVAVGSPAKIIALKFSKEDIIRHENALYSKEEQLSNEIIDNLFSSKFEDLHIIGDSFIEKDDIVKLQEIVKREKIIINN